MGAQWLECLIFIYSAAQNCRPGLNSFFFNGPLFKTTFDSLHNEDMSEYVMQFSIKVHNFSHLCQRELKYFLWLHKFLCGRDKILLLCFEGWHLTYQKGLVECFLQGFFFSSFRKQTEQRTTYLRFEAKLRPNRAQFWFLTKKGFLRKKIISKSLRCVKYR